MEMIGNKALNNNSGEQVVLPNGTNLITLFPHFGDWNYNKPMLSMIS